MLLGTGAPEYEELFRKMSHEHDNFFFTNGQSESLIDSLYLESDLYFMPSLFEPCGISQMLAMRNGVPCLVHHTGGLKDTVKEGKTGFAFNGASYEDKLKHMLEGFDRALNMFQNEPESWKKLKAAAKRKRFTWEKSVDAYYKHLY